MPPVKELHYFDRLVSSDMPGYVRSLPFVRKEADRIKIARERAIDERDRNFLNAFEQLSQEKSLDLKGYAGLFKPKGELLAGDITPGYSTLDDAAITSFVARFPATK